MTIPVTSSNSIKSLGTLKESVAFEEIDKELFELLKDPVSNGVIEEVLLDQYFPDTKSKYRRAGNDLFSQLEMQILQESRESYAERISELRKTLS